MSKKIPVKKAAAWFMLLACVIGVTGCMMNRPSFQEEALSYLQEKYNENFQWIEPAGGHFGSSRKSGYVSSSSLPGEKILVTGERGNLETFKDNYMAHLLNDEASSKLQEIASSVDAQWRVFCKPKEVGLSIGKNTTAMEYLQQGGGLVRLFVNNSDWESIRDDQMEAFRKALWREKIYANITVNALPQNTLAGITFENYEQYLNKNGQGRFIMDEKGNFAISQWR